MTSFAFCKLHIKISLYFILFESPRGMVLQRRGPGVTESSKRKKKCCKNVTWSQIRYYKSYSNFIPIADNVMKEADFSKWDPPSLCVCPSMQSFRVPKLHGSQMRYVEVEERPYQVLDYHQVNAFFHSDEMRKAHYLFLSHSPSLSLGAMCAWEWQEQRESIYHPIQWTASKRNRTAMNRTDKTVFNWTRASICSKYIWFVHWTAISRRPQIRRSLTFCLKIQRFEMNSRVCVCITIVRHHHFHRFEYFIILNIQRSQLNPWPARMNSLVRLFTTLNYVNCFIFVSLNFISDYMLCSL